MIYGTHSCFSAPGASCVRPVGWCRASGQTYLMVDCDGDKIIDPVCSDSHGNLWYVGSASECQDPWSPKGSCKSSCFSASGASCVRPAGWCRASGQTYLMVDCDGDKIIDPVCSDSHGNLWYVGSASECQDPWSPKGSCKSSLQ